jgi:galactan 5-O-arabinofuranosyltransferase
VIVSTEGGAVASSRVPRSHGTRRAGSRPARALRAAPALLLEAVVAFGASLVLPFLARSFKLDPLNRIAQVSGLAAIQFRFALFGLLLVALVMLAMRLRGGRHFDLVTRIASAGVAGLASGFVAAGAVVALLGTPWPMFGLNGDSGRIVEWSQAVAHGLPSPSPVYPPLPLYTLGYYAQWFHDGNTAYAFKDLQILGTAAFGPLVYLAWRMLLSPIRALAFGALPAFALIDAYKPYSQTVLVVLIPVLAAMVVALRNSGGDGWRPLLLKGAGFGALLGVLFLTYSGWFLWSAVGVVFAALLFFPWRTGPVKGVSFLSASVAAFLLVAGSYLWVMLTVGQDTKDYNFRFDNFTDPAYYLMWRTDMPGAVTQAQWPPAGEFGGVGLFAILTFVCLGVAVWLGIRKPLVVTVVAMFLSAWVMRMYIASHMYSTQTVQLYTRTDNQLLYCGLIICALVAHLVSRRLAEARSDGRIAAPGFPGRQAAVVGTLCALLMLLGTVASSMSDRYMPAKDGTYRIMPWVSHTVRKLDGTCPKFAPGGQCSKDGDQTWLTYIR